MVKTQQRVTNITESSKGIRVVLADGTVEQWHIIVGCDGVNSIVRQAVWAKAKRTVPGHIASTEKRIEGCIITFE